MEGIIYYIDCGEKDYYVGSTTNTLHVRQRKHKSKMKEYPNRRLYKTLIERNIELKLIEFKKVIYYSIKQLRFFEEQARLNLKASMNEIKCFQSKEQRKEQKRLYMKEYYKRKKQEKKDLENNL